FFQDWLKCNICFNNYNESSLRPRSLNCGHTFCEICLKNTIQNGTITCPQCRKIQAISSASDIPINFTVEGLLKSLSTCSEDISKGAISNPTEVESNSNGKCETQDNMKSLLEQQEKSLSAQKGILKRSAGMCNEHPSKECMFRCFFHKCWVCEQCIEELGDHSKQRCNIISFNEEIQARRQENKKILEDEGKSSEETLSMIERHISYLRDERERHISLVNTLQELANMHKKEEKNLEYEISSFQKIIEKGKNLKKKLLDDEAIILKAVTLDESNAARDIVKHKEAEARNWMNTSQKEIDEGKLKIEKMTSSALATEMSLEYREQNWLLLQQDLEKNINKSGNIESSGNKKRLNDATELMRRFGFMKSYSSVVHSTTAQDVISYFNDNGTKVYTVLLDISKGFDQIDYVKLFDKLLENEKCPLVIRYLLQKYINKKFKVRENNASSDIFDVTNGLHLERILSNLLHSMYFDELLSKLRATKGGCHFGHRFVGALGVPDDLILLAPSIFAMNKMLKICESFAAEYCFTLNGSENKLLIFNTYNTYQKTAPPFSYNGESIPNVESAIHLGNILHVRNRDF
ncbi:unnamed protein product, partial [Meganyctiphanes norvegica]